MSSQHTAKSLLIFASQTLSLGIRFLSNIILAWLLVPADFGVAAVVFTIITGVTLFSDIGINDALIRNDKGEQKSFIETAQSLMVLRGIFLYFAIFLIAPLCENYFNIENLATYLRYAAISTIITGFTSARMAQLQRNLIIKPAIIIDLVAQLITFMLVLVIAFNYRNVWALVLSSIFSSMIIMLLSQIYRPSIPAITSFKYIYSKEIISFGKWLLLSSLFTFMILNSDRLILVKLTDTTVTGVYNLGLMFASIVFGIHQSLVLKILYPVVSECSRQGLTGDRADRRITKVLSGYMPFLLVATIMIFIISPIFFNTLYSIEYKLSGVFSQMLVLVYWFMILYVLGNRVIIAHNRPGLASAYTFVTSIFRIVFCIYGYKKFGMTGFILGLGLGSVVGIILQQIWIRSRLGIKLNYVFHRTVFLLSFFVVYMFTINYFQIESVLVEFGIVITTMMFCITYLTFLYYRPLVAFIQKNK